MRKTMMIACAGMLAACSMAVLPPAPAPLLAAQPAPAAPAALAGEGRYAEAIALLEERVQRTPNAALLGDLGYAYYLGGHLEQAQAMLERACLLEPSRAEAWERLAALMEAIGESGRALQAMRHARTLREAAASGAGAEAGQLPGSDAASVRAPYASSGAANSGGIWPAGMAHVEVRQVHAGLVEVTRVEGAAAPVAPPARLEVSNGNGIRGMAAAVAQRLRAEGMQVVRLTNTIPFNVEETRVEVRGRGEPQLRIVLGKDAGIKKPPAVGGRQAP